MTMKFNHFDEQGHAVMVDISDKQAGSRMAIAMAEVRLTAELLDAIQNRDIAKGDVLGVARLAGIMATKKTPELIPLSHPLSLNAVTVDFTLDHSTGRIVIECMVRSFERTGVEMEAMTGASVAALTIYDMCKGYDKSITIAEIKLLYKEGGKSGVYRREESS